MIVSLQKNILKTYFLLTYLLVLWLVSDSIAFSSIYEQGWLPFSFMLLAFLLYGLYYLLPAIGFTALTRYISGRMKPNSVTPT